MKHFAWSQFVKFFTSIGTKLYLLDVCVFIRRGPPESGFWNDLSIVTPGSVVDMQLWKQQISGQSQTRPHMYTCGFSTLQWCYGYLTDIIQCLFAGVLVFSWMSANIGGYFYQLRLGKTLYLFAFTLVSKNENHSHFRPNWVVQGLFLIRQIVRGGNRLRVYHTNDLH